MPRKHYAWEKGQVPEIAPHSLAKHRILREYVQRYIEVLTANVGQERLRLSLVDGFAGGGQYLNALTGALCPGSPIIMMEAVQEAEAKVNLRRSKKVRVEANYIFVEKKPAVVGFLREVLARRPELKRSYDNLTVLQGDFVQSLEPVIASVRQHSRKGRAILVLDQYGYSEVPIGTLARIFSALPQAEVFLTLAVGWITTYLPNAWVAAEKLGIRREVFDRISGDEDSLTDLGNPNRRPDLLAVQKILYYAFTQEAASRFYTPFFIVSRESHRAYWFLHIANNVRAHDVVKTLHWQVENHFEHFGRPGLVMLGYDPNEDFALLSQQEFRFNQTAEERTRVALLEELPRRVSLCQTSHVTFVDLVRQLSNETPATEAMLAKAVSALCVGGELEKVGEKGQRRAATTLPLSSDLIRVARQGRLFSFPKPERKDG